MAGSNMKIISQHPAYSTSPTTQFRSMLGVIPFIGSPERGAKAFVALAQKKDQLPLRIQLGTDSFAIVRHTAAKTLADSERWETISHSTNIDGIDEQDYTRNLMAAFDA